MLLILGLHVGAICANYSGEYSSFIKNKISNYDGVIYQESANVSTPKATHEDTCEKLIFKDGKLILATGNPNDKEDNAENNVDKNTDNNIDNTMENNANNNVENNTGNKIENNEENVTKLPQTGEESNKFVTWLSIVILLGIFWLGSMLLIDREKKKITKK